jgi:hypothetical protein
VASRTCWNINPNSHGGSYVSHLTAAAYMRQCCKGDMAEYEKKSGVCGHPSDQTILAAIFKTEQRSWHFIRSILILHVDFLFQFYHNWQNPQSILALNLFGFYSKFCSYGLKKCLNYCWFYSIWGCVSHYPQLPARVQNRISAFKNYSV